MGINRHIQFLIFVLLGLISSTFEGKSQLLFQVNSVDNINTRDYEEFAPVIYKDGIVIATYRKQQVYKVELDMNEKEAITDLYFVSSDTISKSGSLEFFSKELNTSFHEAKCTFSKDGNTIYFTRNYNSKNEIYRAVKSGGDWGNQVLISLNSNEYAIKDPCLSQDGKKLYFASQAKDGFGGYDIYVSTFIRGDWSAPKNLGPSVNTSGNEVAPFIHPNGKLYFSSNKLPGLGRFDIFYTREINGSWVKPINLPEPINSNRDDNYYFSDAGDSTGYFSSNRNRSFDIFKFRSLWPKFENCKPLEKNEYTYLFSEKGSVNTDTTTWLYEWDFGDNTKKKVKETEVEHTFPAPGEYMVQLNVIDTLTGEISMNEAAYQFEVKDVEQPYITCPETVPLNTNVKFDASLTNLPEFKSIASYYWDFGDGDTGLGITVDHAYILPGNFTVKLFVVSVPDESGIVKKACVSKDIVVIPSS